MTEDTTPVAPSVSVEISAACESWPLREVFNISRGAKITADVVVASIRDGDHCGQGECVPYARYSETAESTCENIRALQSSIAQGQALTHDLISTQLPPGAARNALDCALWDLTAKRTGQSVNRCIDRAFPQLSRQRPQGDAPLQTCLTISLAAPDRMAQKARDVSPHKLLKLKLGDPDPNVDVARLKAVRKARPDARIVVDANEGWNTPDALAMLLSVAESTGVELIEQPLPADQDGALAHISRTVRICADEALPPDGDISAIADRYDAVNIKLDKAGGLSAAIALLHAARSHGLRVMIGSMVATSLSMAPAFRLAELGADWIDLDSPLLLAEDRAHAMTIDPSGLMSPPTSALWG
ncbi:MAG: dipeptide epimerase [Pseudomonadota bacterium]